MFGEYSDIESAQFRSHQSSRAFPAIVEPDGDHVIAGVYEAGDIEDEAGVTACMLTDASAVDKDLGVLKGCLEFD